MKNLSLSARMGSGAASRCVVAARSIPVCAIPLRAIPLRAILVCVMLVCVMLACALLGSAMLAPAALAEEQEFDCVMDPSLRVNLGSSIPGLLEAVLVQRGDRVHAGQVVARLVSDVEAAQVALDRLRAASTAEIEAREAQLTLSRHQLERTQDLYQHQVATLERLDELRAQTEINDRELRLARQAQEVTRLELLRSEAYLRQREIRSPIDGLVTERLMTGGEYVHQEAIILRLARLDPLYVETFLPVRLYPVLHGGLEAVVAPAAPIGGSIPARVAVVDQLFDAASGTFGVRLELANADGRLPAGHRCKVSFQLGE